MNSAAVITLFLLLGMWTPACAGEASAPVSWEKTLGMALKVSAQGNGPQEDIDRAQDSAIGLARESLALAIEQNGTQHASVGFILNRIGDYNFHKKAYATAESLWIAAYKINSDSVNGDFHEAREGMHRLGLLFDRYGVFGAEARVVEAIRGYRDSVLNSESSTMIFDLWSLANTNEWLHRYDDMYDQYHRVVALWDPETAAHPRWVVRTLVTLAEGQSKPTIGNVGAEANFQDSAIALGERALSIAETYIGADDTLFAFVASRLGDYYSRNGRTTEALSLWERAQRINEAELPADHIEVQGSIIRIASIYLRTGRYAEAEELSRRAVVLRTRTQGPGHPETAGMYMRLGRLYHLTGDYTGADSCYRRALAIRENAFESIPSDVAQCFRFLGLLAFDQGRFRAAESHFRHALTIREEALGADHTLVASCCEDLAQLFVTWGRSDDAEQMLIRALAIRRSFNGPRHPVVGRCLQELAAFYVGRGDIQEAEDAIHDAVSILAPIREFESSVYAACLGVQADIDLHHGTFQRAVERVRERLAVEEVIYGDDKQRLIPTLAQLATVSIACGDSAEAEAVYRRIIAVAGSGAGSMNPALANALVDFARFSSARGHGQEALRQAGRAFAIHRRLLRDGAQVLAETDALRYAAQLTSSRDLYLSLILMQSPLDATATARAADLILATKGTITDEILARYQFLRESDAPELRAIRDSLRMVRSQLSFLYVQGSHAESTNGADSEFSELENARDRLEATVARVGESSGHVYHSRDVNLATVMAAMPDSMVLVEYLRFGRQSSGARGTVDHYLALVLDRSGQPLLQDLGPAAPIDSLAMACQQQMTAVADRGSLATSEDLAAYRAIATRLTDAVWQPIASQMRESDLAVVSPDGMLNTIAFGALPVAGDRFLIEDLSLHYISAGRDILRDARDEPYNDGLAAFGDPDYNAPVSDRLMEENAWSEPSPSFARLSGDRHLRSTCEELNELILPQLAGTRAEVAAVATKWNDQGRKEAAVYYDARASEENFKLFAPGQRVIHVATHGFFGPGTCAAATAVQSATAGVGESPLLQSGLCFAGANLHGAGADQPGAEDGFLTAEEVIGMDLTGTQWVVLSGCETGLGVIEPGHGIYGLRRAFRVAGAQTVISTLWKIPDQDMVRLMRLIYEHAQEPVPKVMRKSARSALAEMRRRGQPEHPFHWAPFIAAGAWHGLSRESAQRERVSKVNE